MSKFDLIKDTLNETALLNRYLKSRGINPEFVSKDQKVAHSKSNNFKNWSRAHVNDPIREGMSMQHTPTEKRLHALKRASHFQKEIRTAVNPHVQLHSEAVDKKDTITFDIPLLIRVLEFAREELKSDVNLHKMVERLISMRGKGTLTMNQYGRIIKEEFQDLTEEQIDEISKELANRYMYSAKSDRAENDAKISKATEKQGKEWSSRRHKSIGKMLAKGEKRTTGIGRALDRLTKEEVEQLDEVGEKTLRSYLKQRSAGRIKSAASTMFKSPDSPEAKAHNKKEAGMARARTKLAPHNQHLMPKKAAPQPTSTKTLSTSDAIAQDYKDQEKKRGIGHVRDHVEVQGNVVEAKEANYGGDYQSTVLRVKELAKKKPVDMASLAARMQAAYKKEDEKNKVKESLEPMAACNCPSDGANNPDDTVKGSTAKKVKLLLGGKKQVTEEMYDHEKEDKSTAPLGKKAKFQKPGVDSVTKEQPQAAAVLTGGKTMTGEPRDTIEIDPMMNMRKPSPTSQKSV